MKTVSIRELHESTGQWVRQAAQSGEVMVTDRGRVVARIVPAVPERETPYFSRRTLTPAFRKLSGALAARGADSTRAISEDRDS